MFGGLLRGISALINSGILFNPMVLLGIVTGFFLTFSMLLKDVYALFADMRFYFAALVLAAIYEIGMRLTVKKSQGFKVSDLVSAILGSAAKWVLAVILSVFFAVMLGAGSFGGEEASAGAEF